MPLDSTRTGRPGRNSLVVMCALFGWSPALNGCLGGDSAAADASQSAPDLGGRDGNDGVASSDGTVGDLAVPDALPSAPPPAPSPCERVGAQYAGGGCQAPCPPVEVACDFPLSLVACHPKFGCLTGVEREAACEMGLEEVLDCAGDYTPCETDADCVYPPLGGGPPRWPYCVRAEGASKGTCASGQDGQICAEGADCLGLVCSRPEGEAFGQCRTVAEYSACAVDSDCGEGRCVESPNPNGRGLPPIKGCTFAPVPTVRWSGDEVAIELPPVPPAGYKAYFGIAVPRIPEPAVLDDWNEWDATELCFLPGPGGVDLGPVRRGERCIDLAGRTAVTLRSVNESLGGQGPSAWVRGETTLLTPEFTDGERGPVAVDAIFQVVHVAENEALPSYCFVFGNCEPGQFGCGPDRYVGGLWGCKTIYGTFEQ